MAAAWGADDGVGRVGRRIHWPMTDLAAAGRFFGGDGRLCLFVFVWCLGDAEKEKARQQRKKK